jgi:hypothetical protein
VYERPEFSLREVLVENFIKNTSAATSARTLFLEVVMSHADGFTRKTTILKVGGEHPFHGGQQKYLT